MNDSSLRHRVRYSIEYKQLVLNELQYRSSNNQRTCAYAHGIDTGMLSRWVQQNDTIFSSPKASKSVGSGPKAQFPELERVVLDWIKSQRNKGLAVKNYKMQRYIKKYIVKHPAIIDNKPLKCTLG